MKDLFEKCNSDAGYFGKQRAAGDMTYTRPLLEPNAGRIMEYDGKPHVMWSVNNYLGLADHPEIRQVAAEAVAEYGISSPMGSRMMTGNTPYHLELERELARVSQKEAAFLFNYGYLGVIGTVQSLCGPDDIIIMDKLAHASIVDGAFLAPAQVRVFRHNSPESLEIVLKRVNRERKGGVMVLTEGVYGMTGDLADLKAITDLCRRYEARLYVDDAHGWGVIGEAGRGTGDYLGVHDGIDVYFGTFAKAFAAIGGFSSGPKAVCDWIAYNARTQVFAKSLPMVYVKSLRKTLEIVENGEEYRAKMWRNSAAIKSGLRELGYFVGPGDSPICSVFAPLKERSAEEVGIRTVEYLRGRGVFVTAVVYPVVPLGLCMFRMIPTAAHTEEDIAVTVEAFRGMRDELGLDLTFGDDERDKVKKVYGEAAERTVA